MSQNGKGSKPRPFSVSYEEYSDNFDNIFRKKPKKRPTAKKEAKPEKEDDRCNYCAGVGTVDKDYTLWTCPRCDGSGKAK